MQVAQDCITTGFCISSAEIPGSVPSGLVYP
jgi:hypothetical protein